MGKLASNPVLAANPGCLGDFIKALVQPKVEQVPTPMAVDLTCSGALPNSKQPTTPSPASLQQQQQPMAPSPASLQQQQPMPPSPASLQQQQPMTPSPASSQQQQPMTPSPATLQQQQLHDDDDERAIASRKLFWAKFKRPHASANPDGGNLLAQPTMETEPVPTAPSPASAEPLPTCPSQVSLDEALEVVDPMEVRFSKMDDVKLRQEIAKAKQNPEFNTFATAQGEGFKVEQWGTDESQMVSELACFYHWLGGSSLNTCDAVSTVHEPEPAATPTIPDASQNVQANVTVTSASENLEPSNALVPAAQGSETIQQPPAPAHDVEAAAAAAATATQQPELLQPPRQPGDSTVAEALKRLQTVDLENGCRPPQTLAQLGKPDIPCKTIVLMELSGIQQPVSLPLTPEQCVAAGLQLANPPHDKVVEPSLTSEATPRAETPCASGAEVDDPDLDKV